MINTIISLTQSDQSHMRWRESLQPPSQKEWVHKTLLHMGYPDLQQVNAEILQMTNALSVLVIQQARPVFLFKSQTLTRTSKNGFEAIGLMIKSCKWGIIAAKMNTPKEVCCFGLTLGDEIETTNKAMSEKSLAQGFIWDALCSTLAEYYADRVEICLALYYKQSGLEITRRFSPGYCDLPFLQAQKAIFGFCDMEAIGIRMSSSGLMTPRKSITGMVLTAKNVPLKNPCSICKKNCPHRRTDDETICVLKLKNDANPPSLPY